MLLNNLKSVIEPAIFLYKISLTGLDLDPSLKALNFKLVVLFIVIGFSYNNEGIEFKPRRSELKGLFEGELVYYYINKREQIRILTFYNREQIKLVGKVINEGKYQFVKIPKKDYRVFIDDRKNYENEIVVV